MLSEEDVLSYLTQNETYANYVMPYIKTEYFSSENKIIFKKLEEHFNTYGNVITYDEIQSVLNDLSVNQQVFDTIQDNLKTIYFNKKSISTIEWWIDKTEEFCKEKAVYNAILESINIIDKKSKKNKSVIPEMLSSALSVSFDTSIGHHFFNDNNKRYEYYHTDEVKVSFNLDTFNKITAGGLPRKTLNVFAAATGVGKSLFLCHLAGYYYLQGYNVLYITLEMSEEQIAKRIDMNLLDLNEKELIKLSREEYLHQIEAVNNSTTGHLIIKEYPTAGANSEHFKMLIKEIQQKQGITPDVLIVDYLTICSSTRYKPGSEVGSYFIGKAIAEEIRGLAVQFNMVGLSAVQFNRGGYNNSDSDLNNISESSAIAMTVDSLFGMLSTAELRELNQIMIKQLKNRYGDLNYYNKFLVGVDYTKMRIFELDQDDSSCNEPTPSPVSVKADKNINSMNKKDKFKTFNIEN